MKLRIIDFFLFPICMELLQISLLLVKINGSFEVLSVSPSCHRLL